MGGESHHTNNDIISGYYEFQTILFQVTIIFVIMLTACHFGNILRLYSHFQKILATVNKIISSINILLPIFLPATTQAATITYDDTEFYVNYYDLFMYMIQIMVTMVVFSAIVWTCTQIGNCFNTRNVGKLHEK